MANETHAIVTPVVIKQNTNALCCGMNSQAIQRVIYWRLPDLVLKMSILIKFAENGILGTFEVLSAGS